jgi:regulator of protease activity HflC (stomatin/prohibitin superfamily)
VIRGPCHHIPKNATEWTHQFSWHGSVSNDPASNGRKVKDAVKFTKLRVCPEQTYFDVEGVRTKDDALVSVKVMIFYRLSDIDVMLKETHDPTADFINSVSSDVIEFVAGKSFEEFKAATDTLNDLSAYKQLTSRAKGIGFEVTKVVFRGYGAPTRLQKMHDDAIERRTKLALDRENEDQEQELLDMKLEREEDRLRKHQQMEMETKEHERKLQRAAHEAKQLEMLEDRKAQLEHLTNMKSTLGISGDQLSSYLLATEQGPPSKLVQIVGGMGGSDNSHGSFVIQDAA